LAGRYPALYTTATTREESDPPTDPFKTNQQELLEPPGSPFSGRAFDEARPFF
jgi:hypothetical protein